MTSSNKLIWLFLQDEERYQHMTETILIFDYHSFAVYCIQLHHQFHIISSTNYIIQHHFQKDFERKANIGCLTSSASADINVRDKRKVRQDP